ncbi:malate dehydrogenase [candidate division KSB1 bacterium]|nr:MAG: malate dehydrogenase [candidate division KSB1 bacterium]
MKVTVIGAGNVGASTAYGLAQKNIVNEIVLIDVLEGVPQGKALDMYQSAPVEGYDTRIIGTNNYADTKNSDVIVMTAGKPRKPGMSREDLLSVNIEIVKDAIGKAAKESPNAFLIVVANPLDAMCYGALKVSGFPSHRVCGMAGILDTARFRAFIAMELHMSVRDIDAIVLGGHGDTMVPVTRLTMVGGVPLTSLVSKERIDAMVTRTQNGGAEIVKLLGTSAWYAPAAATVETVESYVLDQKRVLPSAAWLQGQYGVKDLFMGVPVVVGRGGVEKILEIPLNDDEKAMFKASADKVRATVEETKVLLNK